MGTRTTGVFDGQELSFFNEEDLAKLDIFATKKVR